MGEIDPRRLRPACKLAVSVARTGEQADPRVSAPPELRPVLGFSRLSEASYTVIRRVIDGDGIFRARVAEEATEADVGRVGWLWLHRPVGWAEDPAVVEDDRPSLAAAPPARDATAKLRKQLARAEREAREANDRAAALRRDLEAADAARAQADEVGRRALEDRHAAVRRTKDLESELAQSRRDLKLAREATRQAEAELLATSRADRSPAPSPISPDEAFDPAPVAQAVSAAAAAAAELAAALAETADVLGRRSPSVAASSDASPRPAPPAAARSKRGRSSARTAPALPPGVFGDSPAAHRHLVADKANLLVVDGYNVARESWNALAPEEERRRVVALLEEVQARSGGSVVVVFDGDDAVVGPASSRSVRVRFSASGQTADQAIAELVASVDLDRPVVVVSSDREVAADARGQGAAAVGSRAFLRATGR